jgi:hypothetical protein
MSVLIRDTGGTQRVITAIQVRDAGGTARTISEVRVRDSNSVSRLVFSLGSALSATADPPAVGGVAYVTGNVTTIATTVTPSGGVSPYTYAWAVLTHSNVTPPTPGAPTSATTGFFQSGVVTYDVADFRCTVTDDVGATTTVDVEAIFINEPIP